MLSVVSPQYTSKQDWARKRNFDNIPCSTADFNAILKSVHWSLRLSSSIAEGGEKENIGSTCSQHIYNSSKKPVRMAFKPDRNSVLVQEGKLTLNLKAKVFSLPVFSSPSFNKTHSYGTHSSKLINCFETLIHRLSQKSSKFLVIKDF